ncbi:MAG TPA: glutaminyl-peptide cyclotransferase [Gammaproteobacteria bacterium]|nr:glutaminyl-peptide cyclotransferase [Gammaproteobacteria bacterium]
MAVIAVGLAAWPQLGARRDAAASFEVVAAYPHDPNAFTQGLAIEAGRLYEGTGQYGASTVRRVDLQSGRPEKQRALNQRYFGEGIAILGGLLYQITWQNNVVVVYDLETFEVERTMQYDGEGWGLTHDGRELIMSDGSATIRFRDPKTFAVTREIEVRADGAPLRQLNELEYIDGEIWANIRYDDRIARISPANGAVLGFIDLATLYPQSARTSEAVLNGIAYDAAAKRLFVTGKNWPQLYEIKVARP